MDDDGYWKQIVVGDNCEMLLTDIISAISLCYIMDHFEWTSGCHIWHGHIRWSIEDGTWR